MKLYYSKTIAMHVNRIITFYNIYKTVIKTKFLLKTMSLRYLVIVVQGYKRLYYIRRNYVDTVSNIFCFNSRQPFVKGCGISLISSSQVSPCFYSFQLS